MGGGESGEVGGSGGGGAPLASFGVPGLVKFVYFLSLRSFPTCYSFLSVTLIKKNTLTKSNY